MSTGTKRNVMENEKKLGKRTVCNMKANIGMRKVRIIYNDPDATDSSGDDENNDQTNRFGERIKRVVKEVYIPMHSSGEGSELSAGVGETKSNKAGGDEEKSGSSLLRDYCNILDTLHDSRESVAGKRRDGLFDSLLNLDDSVINYKDEMWMELERSSPFWGPELGCLDPKLGEEETAWFNSL